MPRARPRQRSPTERSRGKATTPTKRSREPATCCRSRNRTRVAPRCSASWTSTAFAETSPTWGPDAPPCPLPQPRGSRGDQRVDLAVRDAGLAQDLERVFAEPRRKQTDRARCLAVRRRHARQAHAPFRRMVDELPEPGRLELRIAEERLERVDDHPGDVVLVEDLEPLGIGTR